MHCEFAIFEIQACMHSVYARTVAYARSTWVLIKRKNKTITKVDYYET